MRVESARRVVIAEDEALIRLDLKEMLQEDGYEVVGEAGDGETAGRLAGELKPDLVILDVKMPVLDGISAAELSNVSWRRSARSGALGNCVEVARLADGAIAMRNSRFPTGPALIYTPAEIAAFLAGVRDGEFDDLATG